MKLAPSEVHLYHFVFDPIAPLLDDPAILPPEDIQRGKRFVKEVDQKRFYTCYRLLRKILGNYLEINPIDIIFENNQYGKPAILSSQNPRNLQFNISHSKHHLFFGFCLDYAIGVDIEETDRKLNVNDLAKQVLSEQELDIFMRLPEEDKIIGFFNAWTRKEAFVKAIGMGLHFPLKKFSVTFTPDQAETLLDIQDDRYKKEAWSLKHFDISETVIAAVAIDNLDPIYKIQQIASPMTRGI